MLYKIWVVGRFLVYELCNVLFICFVVIVFGIRSGLGGSCLGSIGIRVYMMYLCFGVCFIFWLIRFLGWGLDFVG